jgi:hypothetical protein
MATEQKLTLEIVNHKLIQLKRISGLAYSTVPDLAKELGVRKTVLLDFMDANSLHFTTCHLKHFRKQSALLAVASCFLDPADNSQNKDLYVEKRQKLHSKDIQLSAMDNYGQISGYYIAPSSNDLERQYLNTDEKIQLLVKRFELPQARYSLGGFGDSSVIEPKDGFQISQKVVETLIAEGWTVTPKALTWTS